MDLFYARWQMGLSLGFHIIFAVIGMAMPIMMVAAETAWLRTRRAEYLDLAKRWARGTAILFAVGAVSGTVLSFELGLLWPAFMAFAGPIIGCRFLWNVQPGCRRTGRSYAARGVLRSRHRGGRHSCASAAARTVPSLSSARLGDRAPRRLACRTRAAAVGRLGRQSARTHAAREARGARGAFQDRDLRAAAHRRYSRCRGARDAVFDRDPGRTELPRVWRSRGARRGSRGCPT